jgi:hypothetical protein
MEPHWRVRRLSRTNSTRSSAHDHDASLIPGTQATACRCLNRQREARPRLPVSFLVLVILILVVIVIVDRSQEMMEDPLGHLSALPACH